MVNNVLDKFNESIGYEKFLLEESLEVMSANIGENYRFGIIFSNHKYESHCIQSHDSLSDGYKSAFVKESLLPLIFISSYKIIDMLVEYILSYNNFNVPWRFAEKITFMKREINSIKLPSVLTIDEFRALFDLYSSLVHNRNSLIHGTWGQVEDGNLLFNNGTNISTDKVIALANIAYLITRVLNMNNGEMFYNSMKYTIHKNLNIVSDLTENKFNKFKENVVLYYEVKYKINEPYEKINMAEVRKYINDDLKFWEKTDITHKFEGIYNLFVITANSIWKIPSSEINEDTEFIYVKDYLNYIQKKI